MPRSYKTSQLALGSWVNDQHSFMRQYESTKSTNKNVKSKRYELLSFIGMNSHSPWEKQFAKLVAYRAIHHNCNVPTRGSSLGRWVSKMRKQYKTYDLCKEKPKDWNDEKRLYRLKEVGFVFRAGIS